MLTYLSGAINATVLANPRPDLGLMIQPGMGNSNAPLGFVPFAADNGCFSQGARFDAGKWLAWLGTLRPYRENCLFAVAPDVVGDAVATLERSSPFLWVIETLGFVPAFVTQDGCTTDLVPWGKFGYLFIGGTDAWKFSRESVALVREAQARGVPVHNGRVNTWERMQRCAGLTIDSVDGTYLKYGPDVNWPTLLGWLDRINPDVAVSMGGAELSSSQQKLWEAV